MSALQFNGCSFLCSNVHVLDKRAARRGWQVRRCLVVAIFPSLLFLSGCSEKRVEVFPVSGKVTYKGQAPTGATVVLHPADAAKTGDFAPTGTVKSDGTFSITSYDPDDGAPQGEYVATIEWYKFEKSLGGVGPNVIPKKYTSAKTSPIKLTVSNGASQLQPITIN